MKRLVSEVGEEAGKALVTSTFSISTTFSVLLSTSTSSISTTSSVLLSTSPLLPSTLPSLLSTPVLFNPFFSSIL